MGKEDQKKGSSSDASAVKAERKQAKRALFEQNRKEKRKIKPNTDKTFKVTRLDYEANESLVKREYDEAMTFMCFRCNEDKNSKNRFEWSTSEGIKTLCNGCNGFLVAARSHAKPSMEKLKKREEKAAKYKLAAEEARRSSATTSTGGNGIHSNGKDDETIACKDCGTDFVFSSGEKEFYAAQGFDNKPVRCKACKDTKKDQLEKAHMTAGSASAAASSRPSSSQKNIMKHKKDNNAGKKPARSFDKSRK